MNRIYALSVFFAASACWFVKLNIGQSQNRRMQAGPERGALGGMDLGKSAWDGRFMATDTIKNDS
jgi:hypothetical protein